MTWRPPSAGRAGHRGATDYWECLYGDDELLTSVPGIGPVTAPTVRAFLGDGTGFASAREAARYIGITPSNWSSGTVNQPSRAITKEGPAALRLAFYQAANSARTRDPQLAAFYQRLISSAVTVTPRPTLRWLGSWPNGPGRC